MSRDKVGVSTMDRVVSLRVRSPSKSARRKWKKKPFPSAETSAERDTIAVVDAIFSLMARKNMFDTCFNEMKQPRKAVWDFLFGLLIDNWREVILRHVNNTGFRICYSEDRWKLRKLKNDEEKSGQQSKKQACRIDVAGN